MKHRPERDPAAEMPQRAACRACGKTVNPTRGDVLVESIDDPQGRNKGTILWHQACYDRFLEDGEEC